MPSQHTSMYNRCCSLVGSRRVGLLPCRSQERPLLGWPLIKPGNRANTYENNEKTGGLTRGRGIGESQRTQWLLSMPACSTGNAAMQKFTQTVMLHLTPLFRSACKCRSIVFAFLFLFFLFFFFFFVPATSPLTRYLKTGCSKSGQTWQSGRSP